MNERGRSLTPNSYPNGDTLGGKPVKPRDSIYGLYGPALARAASPSSSAESRSVLNLLLARSPRLLGVWRPSGYQAKLLALKLPFLNIVYTFLTIHDLKYSKT